MIKLVKSKSTQWAGNGFGSAPAQWVVKSAPGISIVKLSVNWYAIENGAKIARGFDKAMLLETLATVRPELAQ